MTIIVLGSTSGIKKQALETALNTFSLTATILAVKAASGVAEQPFNNETVAGAQNRAKHAAQLAPTADYTVAIESGLFEEESGHYFDKAVVVILLPSGEFIQAESDGVEFPRHAVEETIRRGPEVWTCGKVLEEWHLIAKHDDPHMSLVGKSRAHFVQEAVFRAFTIMRNRGLI